MTQSEIQVVYGRIRMFKVMLLTGVGRRCLAVPGLQKWIVIRAQKKVRELVKSRVQTMLTRVRGEEYLSDIMPCNTNT